MTNKTVKLIDSLQQPKEDQNTTTSYDIRLVGDVNGPLIIITELNKNGNAYDFLITVHTTNYTKLLNNPNISGYRLREYTKANGINDVTYESKPIASSFGQIFPDHVYITNVNVDDDYVRQGLGSHILTRIEDLAAYRKVPTILAPYTPTNDSKLKYDPKIDGVLNNFRAFLQSKVHKSGTLAYNNFLAHNFFNIEDGVTPSKQPSRNGIYQYPDIIAGLFGEGSSNVQISSVLLEKLFNPNNLEEPSNN